ncbi:MAG: outer membrane protein assembly factor BamE [Lentisphaerae bacterium]|nr:outer membrane protein assembly factor BamE [Lentisphaerota bacterium]
MNPSPEGRGMMKYKASGILVGLAMVLLLGACASWNVDVSRLQLGMEPEAVREAIGKPFAIRASKVYNSDEWTEVWEYLPPMLTWTPKTYWVYFEEGKVVQWGEPGDFTGSASTIREYNPNKTAR